MRLMGALVIWTSLSLCRSTPRRPTEEDVEQEHGNFVEKGEELCSRGRVEPCACHATPCEVQVPMEALRKAALPLNLIMRAAEISPH